MKYFLIIIMMFVSSALCAQPKVINNLLNASEFSGRRINEIGHITKTAKFNRLVGWHGVLSHFGVVGDASNGRVVVVAIDPNLEDFSEIDNAILYGAYSDANGSNTRGEKSWEVELRSIYSLWSHEIPIKKSTNQNQCSYNTERQTGSQLRNKSNWAWGQHTLDMKIYAIAFDDSELADFQFKIPGVYEDPINGTVIDGSDFIRGREYDEILWTSPGESYHAAMVFEGNEVELRGNQTEARHRDAGSESIMFEMWGKALFSTEKIHPNINSDYSYGLWVEKAMVSEDFIMHPKESWADYVFEEGYELPELDEVEAYIQQHKHLPNMPSEKEIVENGYSQHDINVRLLENIEQLTLYKIRQQAEIEESTRQLADHRKQMEQARKLLDRG